MSELSGIIMEISMNRSKLYDMASSARHLQCVKGAVSATWRVEGLIWDMVEDVGAEARPRSFRFYEHFYFRTICCESKRQPGKHSCEQQAPTIMPLTNALELELGDHPSDIQNLFRG
jgi:hypothetical protein